MKKKRCTRSFFSRPLPGRIVIVITYKQKRETLRKKKQQQQRKSSKIKLIDALSISNDIDIHIPLKPFPSP